MEGQEDWHMFVVVLRIKVVLFWWHSVQVEGELEQEAQDGEQAAHVRLPLRAYAPVGQAI